MADHLRRKLERYARLSSAERELLSTFSRTNVRQVEARRDLLREGEKPSAVNLILQGWAIRYKMLEDGRRQILDFLIPGDVCDASFFLPKQMDHSVGALTAVTIAQLPHDMFTEAEGNQSALYQALHRDLLVQLAIQREWTVNLGQRSALERIAHLLCELFARLSVVGLCAGNRCHIPITQTDLSEATGITPVHVNRTLQEMRCLGVIQWKGREVHVPDMAALKRLGMFNGAYLSLEMGPDTAPH